jgi:hypothetical protein
LFAGEVFGSDQLDSSFLSVFFFGDKVENKRISFHNQGFESKERLPDEIRSF